MNSIIRRDPFSSLFSWPRLLEEFDEFQSQKGLRVKETDQDIVVEAVVAGVPSNDVEVEVDDGVLTIKAEKKEENENKSSYYNYYYSLALSAGQWDKANAEVKHGVVTVTIPKTEAQQRRKIEVKTQE